MLLDFQHSFASAILDGMKAQDISDGLLVDPLRFELYVRHTLVSLRTALEDAFPVTRRLVGPRFFAEMAKQFVVMHPPTNGWLSAYGEGFPEFVAQYRSAVSLAYLPDVARIEWARIRAANASANPGLELKSLTHLDPSQLECLYLSLHDAATFIHAPFPVFDIWQAHQHADDKHISSIDLAKGPQDILVTRSGPLEVDISLLSPGDAAFLSALMQHASFGSACQAAVLAEAKYELGTRLGDLVCRRALASLKSEP
jgi:hypothetical protein